MKKLISILLAVLMVAAMFTISAVSAFAAESGDGGELDADMNTGGVDVIDTDLGGTANDADMNVADGSSTGTDNNTTDMPDDGATPELVVGDAANDNDMNAPADNGGGGTTDGAETPTETPSNTEVASTEAATTTAAETPTEVTAIADTKPTTIDSVKSVNGNPKTGDTILAAVAVLIIASACFVGVQVYHKKKKSSE